MRGNETFNLIDILNLITLPLIPSLLAVAIAIVLLVLPFLLIC